jgi:hypothetical protein
MLSLKLSREQLASFLKDPEQVKQFEKLFGLADGLSGDTLLQLFATGSQALAAANEANAAIARLQSSINDARRASQVPALFVPKHADNSAALDYIDLREAPHVTRIKRLAWSPEQTLEVGMDHGVVQQVGLETYARVINQTGATIPNGKVVGFAGVSSGVLSVAPYLADGATQSLYILGIMTHDLADGETGYCTVWGHVRELDTSAWSVGDVLYASPATAGSLTNIKPTAPALSIPVAAVLTSSATGEIFVRVNPEQMKYYGVFDKTTDQSPVAINTEELVTFDATRIANGVTIGSPASRIVVPQSGLYRFEATIQLTSGSSSSKNVWFWFKKNGAAIADTARIVTSDPNNGYIPLVLSEPVSMAANDYIEIAFAANSVNVTIDTVAATAFAPRAPAVVLSVTQIQQ